MKRAFLVDISSFIFRAFYAVRPLTAPDGTPTNAVYGVLSMITKLLKTYKPDYLVFCLDQKSPSFRAEIYPEYKSHRQAMPEDLEKQLSLIWEMADLMHIHKIGRPGYEADDVIGTLVQQFSDSDIEVFIVSGDKDFAQLLKPKVWILDSMKDVQIGPAEALEKWGVKPEFFTDYLGLIGDSSDNIPGVPGVGPKTALKLLENYPTLEDIYINIDSIKPDSLREKLIANKDLAFLSKKLATIVQNIPLELNPEDLIQKEIDYNLLNPFLLRLNFKSFVKNPSPSKSLGPEGAPPLSSNETKTTPDTGLPQELLWKGQVALPPKKKGEGTWIFIDATGNFSPLPFVDQKILGFGIKKLWHEVPQTQKLAYEDLELMSYSLHGEDAITLSNASSVFLSKSILGQESFSELFQIHSEIFYHIEKEFQKESQLYDLYYKLEKPLQKILFEMELEGIRINTDFLIELSKKYYLEIQNIEKTAHELAGYVFNLASPKQLAQVLFGKLGLPVIRKTKTGASTDADVLDKLKGQHPIVELIAEHREISKLKSTYIDSLPQLADEKGRVHTTFNQALTATGRLSSSDPNLQNIPIRTTKGAQIRQAFCTTQGKQLLGLDYSQIELRILAHFSEDPGLMKAFHEDLDIHSATASEVFGVSLNEVNSDQRRIAKAVNFGIAYGQGSFGLAETLGIPRAEAKDIIERYFKKFARIKEYIQDTIKSAEEKGYVESLLGRRRYLHDIKSRNMTLKKLAERAAINAPMQATASDLVKKAMIEVKKVTNLKLLLQIHDELIFEGPLELIQADTLKIKSCLESVYTLRVPLKVDFGVGSTWGDL